MLEGVREPCRAMPLTSDGRRCQTSTEDRPRIQSRIEGDDATYPGSRDSLDTRNKCVCGEDLSW